MLRILQFSEEEEEEVAQSGFHPSKCTIANGATTAFSMATTAAATIVHLLPAELDH